jgi:hypothetical protein
MNSSLQYLTDPKGNKNAVLLPISEWEKIQKDLLAYKKLKNKRAFFEGLASALYEVKLITKAEKEPNSFDDLINEL